MGYPVNLEYTQLIEPFGTTAGRSFPHTGDDFNRKKSASGAPVQEHPDILAAFSGTVISADYHAQAGNRIVIRYWFGLVGVYAHLHRIDVRKGATVKEGQKIGLLGGTGKVSGPHLHYSQYTDEQRALSGIVQYWFNPVTKARVYPTVDAWAKASGLVRPNYKHKGSNPADPPQEEDDMFTEKNSNDLALVVSLLQSVQPRVVAIDERTKKQTDAITELAAATNRIETNVAINKWALTDGTAGLRKAVGDLLAKSTGQKAADAISATLTDEQLDKIGDAVIDKQVERLSRKDATA